MRQRISRKVMIAALAPLAVLGACSEAEQSAGYADEASVEYAEAAMEAESVADTVADVAQESRGGDAAIPQLGDLPVSLPKLAYVYDFSWRMPSEDIGKLQRRHADLCEQQGPASCQILGMSKTGEETDNVRGELRMAVATRHARAFGALLEDEAEGSGAEQISAEIQAEELSKQIVDTEARLRARTELRDRLMEVLRTRKGNVRELVEAERSVARVNEEIDQARSWLKEMEGRVAFSRVNISYETGTPVSSDFLAPVQGALGSLGTIFGWMLALLIVLGAVILPIGGVVWAGRSINRRFNPSAEAEA